MEWTQLRVSCLKKDLDAVCALMSVIDSGLQIEDYSDIEENLMTVYGELIDDSILNADKNITRVSVYIPSEKSASDALSFIKDRLSANKIEAETEIVGLDESDWENSWKQYYHPLHIGERIVVTPPWEEYNAQNGEKVIVMDPGMAFGTGTHETTRLCLRMLEKHLNNGEKVLDIGTGSGILSIAAKLLGAGDISAYDIDPVAVKVAKDNFRENGCEGIKCGVSDLLKGVKEREFDIVLANIVAEIILRMLPFLCDYIKPGARIITSGIVVDKSDEIKNSFISKGYSLVDSLFENDWVSFVFRYDGEK